MIALDLYVEPGPEGAAVIDVFSPVRSDWNAQHALQSLRGAGRDAGANAHSLATGLMRDGWE
jgi:hypothetical protein